MPVPGFWAMLRAAVTVSVGWVEPLRAVEKRVEQVVELAPLLFTQLAMIFASVLISA